MLNNIKMIFFKNKRLIFIICVLLVCSIAIAVGVYTEITDKGIIGTEKKKKNEVDYEELKDNFKNIFSNTIKKQSDANSNYNYDEILYCAYDITEEKDGEYDITAKVPLFRLEGDVISNINKEIFDTFARKIVDIVQNSSMHTIYSLDYVAYVNGNIISLVIKCNYKVGTNPQRTIIQTYNYDIENNKLLSIQDILKYKNLNKEEVQNKVNEEIKLEIKNESIGEQGYNVYKRDEESSMYKIDNTPNYFLGENNCLYLVYAYGNNDFTSQIDLVIF